MKPTGTPAWRLTADCIWSSFRASGKRHLILTGDRGSGKTTLLRALRARLPGPVPGLTSCAEPGRAVWLQEDATGRRVPIGRFDPALPGPENRMRPLPEGFLSLGVPALARCAAAPGGWAAVDEVGYLETACPAYCAALLALLDARRLLAAVRRQ